MTTPDDDDDDIKAAAHRATALPVDAPSTETHFDPEVGERAVIASRPTLLAVEPSQVLLPFCDPLHAAGVALTLADIVRSDRRAAVFAKMPEEAMQGATADRLATLAHALFYLETRTRTKLATTPRARVPARLLSDARLLRAQMTTVIEYVLGRDPFMRVEVADIRARGRHADLAANLGRLATHYSTRQAELAQDVIRYDPKDEDRARQLSKQIFHALSASGDTSLNDLRNRAFTCVVDAYNRIRIAGELIYMHRPVELARFPSLRTAVQALGRRHRAAEPQQPAVIVADKPSEDFSLVPVQPNDPEKT